MAADFPIDPPLPEPGLILADRHGGEVIRETEPVKPGAARRKAMLVRFGRIAADRGSIW